MHERAFHIVLCVTGFTLTVVAGCQTAPSCKASPAPVRFETAPSRVISVHGIEAHVAGENLVVHGKVRRTPGNCCSTTRGAVAILLVSPEGEVIDTTRVAWTPRNIPKGLTRASSFTASLPYVPTEEFSLRVVFSPDD
jgi:hypothetical protein